MNKKIFAVIGREYVTRYLVIPENLVESRQVQNSARSVSDYDEQSDFRNALYRINAQCD